MGCLFNLFTRRKSESSTTLGTEYRQNPYPLYLTWLPQLPPSVSKPVGISYPTVRDIPPWLLLSPVDLPSTAQINESDTVGQKVFRSSLPSSLPYLPAQRWSSVSLSSITAASERVELVDEETAQALSFLLRKEGTGV